VYNKNKLLIQDEIRNGEELNDGCITDAAFLVDITSQVNILTLQHWGFKNPVHTVMWEGLFYRVFKFGAKLCRSLLKIM